MSLPATPAERSRAHFAHGAVHNDVVSRREEGVISTLIHGYMGILKDDLVHTSPIYKKIKCSEGGGRPIWRQRRLWTAPMLFYFQKRINTI